MKDIIIFSGQSNMQGQSERLLGASPIKGALEYLFLSDSLVPLRNPCGENVLSDLGEGYDYYDGAPSWHAEHMLGAACYGNTTLVPAFCNSYIKESGREVAAVHAARGATRLSDWLCPTDRFKVFISKCKAAINKVRASDTVGEVFIVWLQGESDALEKVSKDEYKRMLCEFRASVNEEFPLDGFGIIRVGKFANDEWDLEIIRAQEELGRTEDFSLLTRITGTCTNDHERYINPRARGHYNAEALELIGSAAGKNLGRLVMGKPEELEDEPYEELR